MIETLKDVGNRGALIGRSAVTPVIAYGISRGNIESTAILTSAIISYRLAHKVISERWPRASLGLQAAILTSLVVVGYDEIEASWEKLITFARPISDKLYSPFPQPIQDIQASIMDVAAELPAPVIIGTGVAISFALPHATKIIGPIKNKFM